MRVILSRMCDGWKVHLKIFGYLAGMTVTPGHFPHRCFPSFQMSDLSEADDDSNYRPTSNDKRPSEPLSIFL